MASNSEFEVVVMTTKSPKYGLAAQFVDASRRVLDRRSMGQDLGTKCITASSSLAILFQGGANELIPLMQERFPELGLIKEDFIEMTWIESVLFMNGLSNETSEEALLDRNRSLLPPSFKSKSDFVNEPVPEIAFQGLWPQLLEVNEASTAVQTFIAYGGMMDEISETETPFPHRKGMLYKIHYNIGWQEEENIRSQRYISWMRKLYSYMGPFVSKSPRAAYVNYRDLDIGRNNDDGKAS
ncbi:hypothetical protein GOBAR_DD22580 [Gossypium barbadense]|nr:hypothetical protein GOBAR_DD22580 [Gossypium barbadense]